ncbi:hypothetical protein BpHYR1_033379 [Brachionus plicatilis]|uniref:Uncharacterized protein n=1 Tax=Brachionus plicatilis TaxID=10195 RepID=A0A3M7P2Z9_BRAPC|nr:hypothetical protein BpHYR1_033379 [Brachionus plicatilis]
MGEIQSGVPQGASTMRRSNKIIKILSNTLLNIYKKLIGSKFILELIKDYVSAFINISRICSNKTPLCGIWNEINEWMIENGFSTYLHKNLIN